MTSPPFAAALLMLLAVPAAPGPRGFEGQVIFHQHIVIRIPRMPVPPEMVERPMAPIEWHERDGPKCVDSDDLIAATIPTADQVDLLLRDGERLRARLDKKCHALDFYTGFYVVAGRDGRVCAKRDSIRTRSGDNCPIAKFRRLVPAR